MKNSTAILAALALVGTAVSASAASRIYSLPAGDPLYDGYAVTVDGKAAPVSAARCSAMAFNRRWPGHQRDISQTELCGFTRFELDGTAKITVTANRDFKTFVIRPLARAVKATRDGRRLSFEISEPGSYSVELDGYHNNLTLFADAPEATGCRAADVKGRKGVKYFGPGAHDIGLTPLKSGDSVYIDADAVVYGAFICSNSVNVSIAGRGILDMSRIKEQIIYAANEKNNFAAVSNVRRWHLIRMENCRNVRVEGVTLRDSLCYNFCLKGCENVAIDNVKIIGQWRYNTDGIDLHNCRHARVRGCYVRSFDDSLCFKGHDGFGNMEDAVFEKCVVWNDWGKSLEVGVECRAEYLRNLAFRDIDVIHFITRPLEIANVDYGNVRDVTFENIRVEMDDRIGPNQYQHSDDEKYDPTRPHEPIPVLYASPMLCHGEYSSTGKMWKPGSIDRVRVKNIRVTAKPDVTVLASQIYGIDESHRNSGLVFEDIFLNGKRVSPENGNFLMQGAKFADWRFADPSVTTFRLKGRLGETLDRMIANHVAATDVDYLTAPFKENAELDHRWQTEFWGKWMHVALPYWNYSGNEKLRASVERGLDAILAAQEPSGYIGNYPDKRRCGFSCDVWGMKYTLLGLLHYYDYAKDRVKARAAMAAAQRLCDYVIGELGPNAKRGYPLWQSGTWAGLASSSILEPVMWLHNRIAASDDLGGPAAAKKYLDFAEFIVKGMVEPEKGPRLLDLAEKGMPVADRDFGNKFNEGYVGRSSRRKAYEMMSCYQGLIEYWEAKRTDAYAERLFKAAQKTAELILEHEVNAAGSCASTEIWYGGAKNQIEPYIYQQEACVTITWMRLCEKLLAVTGDPKWADAMEKSFYNAYLAALRRDGGEFAAYTPLSGDRYHGMHHCFMFANCCDANGPRGYLSMLHQFYRDEGDVSTLNFYFAANVPGFEIYTLYPRRDSVRIVSHRAGAHTLRLRIPAWSAKTKVTVNGKDVPGAKAGAYFPLSRTWEVGDILEIAFDMPVVAHEVNRHFCFTRGPILLARDSRFNDGDLSAPLRRGGYQDGQLMTEFAPVASPCDDIWMTFSANLQIGYHTENPEGQNPDAVRFCDYASAGNLWRKDNYYRTWFEITKSPLD